MQGSTSSSEYATGSTCTYRFIPSSLAILSEKTEFDVIVRQQPQAAKMSVVNERDRRPIEPAPILQLKWLNCSPSAIKKYLQSPFYFMVANLVKVGSEKDLLLPSQDYLSGSTVSSLHRLRDIDNTDGGFFVFGDLAVKKDGKFKLHFSLYEIVETTVYNRMTILSDAFTVYIPRKYPGPLEATFLSRMFTDQGVKMRIRKEHRLPSANARKRKEGKIAKKSGSSKTRISPHPSYDLPSYNTTPVCQSLPESSVSDDGHSRQDTVSSNASTHEEPPLATGLGTLSTASSSLTITENKSNIDSGHSQTWTKVPRPTQYPVNDFPQPHSAHNTTMPGQTPCNMQYTRGPFHHRESAGTPCSGGTDFSVLTPPVPVYPTYNLNSPHHSEDRGNRPFFGPHPSFEHHYTNDSYRYYSRMPEVDPNASKPFISHYIPSPPQAVTSNGHTYPGLPQQASYQGSHLTGYQVENYKYNDHNRIAGQMTPPPVHLDVNSSKASGHTPGDRLPSLRSILNDTGLPWNGDRTLPSPIPHPYPSTHSSVYRGSDVSFRFIPQYNPQDTHPAYGLQQQYQQ